MLDFALQIVPPELESSRACHGEESYRNFWWNFSARTPYTFWPKVGRKEEETREIVFHVLWSTLVHLKNDTKEPSAHLG